MMAGLGLMSFFNGIPNLVGNLMPKPSLQNSSGTISPISEWNKGVHIFLKGISPKLNVLCPWCNGYCLRKWTRRYEFKSWTRLIAFHMVLIPLGKVWIQLFSLQLWVNSRADWFLQPTSLGEGKPWIQTC